jgi:CO dehydrogenase maturation factor
MAFTIAVAGKGGVGKTSFCALVIKWLIDTKKTPILAVDADPNSNLSEALGLTEEVGTISDILSKTKDIGGIPTNMSQDEFIRYRLSASLTETEHFDLVAMGGPEGPGCYCFPNNVLKKHLATLAKNYKTIVMDNEAGLEHISRRTTTDNVDVLFILSDTSRRSIRSAQRVYELTQDLKIPIKEIVLVITKCKPGDIEILQSEIDKIGIPVAGTVPMDDVLTQYELSGKALYELPNTALSVEATMKILECTLGGKL